MPELPEVETVRRGLAPYLVGRRIARAETHRAELRFPFPARFAHKLKGRRVEALDRRAKYLLARLDDGLVWVTHLGMTGRWSVSGAKKQPGDFYYAEPPDPAHTHVTIDIADGVTLEFNDPRRFGYMDLIAGDDVETHAWFKGLGPEPLGNAFNAAHLEAVFAGKKTSAKAALMDQRVVAGLGNIYVCEALWRAGISPRRLAGKISAPRLEALAIAVREVLREAIEVGGSTLSDYAGVDGREGGFQQRFAVYDREGEECLRCGGRIVRLVQTGRSSFYCGKCQR